MKLVLFDFDGTLTKPGSLDFAVIRKAVGCPRDRPILEYIDSLPSASRRAECHKILDDHEIEGAEKSQPNPGAEDLLRFLLSRKIPVAIISRNSDASIRIALEKFTRIAPEDFAAILSRDDPFAPKPNPEGILEVAKRFGIPTEEMLMVGDYIYDIEAGVRAGARTVFLTNGRSLPACDEMAEFKVDNLQQLKTLIESLFPLQAGKLPNRILENFLADLDIKSDSLLVAPGVGEDIAAVELRGEEVLVLKSDPITFATDAIGYYSVIVNINDIATSGAVPRWLLASLLFPLGTCAGQVWEVMSELNRVAGRHDLILCGGHTEITDAVNRPVVVAQAVGTVDRQGLIEKRNMKEGDHILLTKGIAVEGTCIIAREFPNLLREAGMSVEEIEICRRFLDQPGISVVEEARIAAASGIVSAMHDVTEGGLATALLELSCAGNHQLRVYRDRIPVLKETERICRALNLDPLGLIGSGSLLIVCSPEHSENLVCQLQSAGIKAHNIAVVMGEGSGVEALAGQDMNRVSWPHFEVDEIARLFQGVKERTPVEL